MVYFKITYTYYTYFIYILFMISLAALQDSIKGNTKEKRYDIGIYIIYFSYK